MASKEAAGSVFVAAMVAILNIIYCDINLLLLAASFGPASFSLNVGICVNVCTARSLQTDADSDCSVVATLIVVLSWHYHRVIMMLRRERPVTTALSRRKRLPKMCKLDDTVRTAIGYMCKALEVSQKPYINVIFF